MQLLLHACCGPCSLEPVRLLIEAGHDVTIANINPNIQPDHERHRRAETLDDFGVRAKIPVLQIEMDPSVWERFVAPLGMDDGLRCHACYSIRFREAALMANEKDLTLSTTLSVSPYQDHDSISSSLTRAGECTEVAVLDLDFTPWYEEATRISREQGMYRQNYCGCRYSAARSVIERAGVRDERKQGRLIAKLAARASREMGGHDPAYGEMT